MGMYENPFIIFSFLEKEALKKSSFIGYIQHDLKKNK